MLTEVRTDPSPYTTALSTALTGLLSVPLIQRRLALPLSATGARIIPYLVSGSVWALVGLCIHPLYAHLLKPIYSNFIHSDASAPLSSSLLSVLPGPSWQADLQHWLTRPFHCACPTSAFFSNVFKTGGHLITSYSSVRLGRDTLEPLSSRGTTASDASLASLNLQSPDVQLIREAYTLQFQVKELERKLDQLSEQLTHRCRYLDNGPATGQAASGTVSLPSQQL